MTPVELCLAEARSYLGVKWRHRGRSRYGVDCIGLVVLALAAAGVATRDRQDYGRSPWNDGLRQELLDHFGEPVGDWQPGDIALMHWDGNREPGHVGLLGDYPAGGLSLIHSYSLISVTEHRLDRTWAARILEVYRPWPR